MMAKKAPIRSVIFIALFFIINVICCLICLPSLLLPRPYFLKIVDWYHLLIYGLERCVLNLDYEVRGQEHLPKDGSFIVAAKHFSTYETFKLRMILHDPAIVLKQELFKIPLWGLFLKKSDVIAIDRSTPEAATESIKRGVERMNKQNRPILIFPQGTRVKQETTTIERPYKSGVYRIHKPSGLPVIPLALNTCVFWPRNHWVKSTGTVTFEFLPPMANDLDKDEFMSKLENAVESKTAELIEKAYKGDAP